MRVKGAPIPDARDNTHFRNVVQWVLPGPRESRIMKQAMLVARHLSAYYNGLEVDWQRRLVRLVGTHSKFTSVLVVMILPRT